MPELDVNGGLTFSQGANSLIKNEKWTEVDESFRDYWIVGFDTAHSWDTIHDWPKDRVENESNRLMTQLQGYTEN